MNVPFSIARRYLFSRGNRNVINIISGIAALGVAIGSLAMIVVLSAFNGLESLVAALYTTVDPDIRIMPVKGKTLHTDSLDLEGIAAWDEVAFIAPVLEETVFLQFHDQQSIVTLRGIPPAYLHHLGLESHVIEGELSLGSRQLEGAVLGFGIADNLNLFVREGVETIKVYAAKREGVHSLNPESKFVVERILPYGIIGLNPEFDFKYFYTSFDFAERLLQYSNTASYLDIALAPGVEPGEVKDKLIERLGGRYEVKTRIELNDVIFKTHATEKWVTFFILSFILMVATFNLIGSLSMLIIEKQRDMALLRALGATAADVRRLFLFEGLLITGIGATVGLGFGIAIILLQQHVGFFPLEGGLVEYYPVELHLPDALAVLAVVFVIGFAASLLPVRVLLKRQRLQSITTS